MLGEMWTVLLQLAPWILLGTVVAGLLHGLLPRDLIRRNLHGAGGVVKAVVLGVPLPLCSCGVIPTGIGLKKDGASNGASIGFLISTPQTGIDSILVSASFLGWPFAIFKVFSATVTGLLGGLLVEAMPDRSLDDFGPRASDGPRTATSRSGVREMIDHGLEIVRSIWYWLVFGIVVSAAIHRFVPESFLTGIGGLGILPAALAALAVSLPLYVCATSSVPIAAALVAGGLPPGAALVFLMAGPATNVATIGAIYRTFGLRTVAIYLATIIAGSVGLAVVFDWLISADAARGAFVHPGHGAWWEQLCAVVLLSMLVWFAVEAARAWRRRHPGAVVGKGIEMTVPVRGMHCGGCASRLERALLDTAGVESAVVYLEPGQAVVRGSMDAKAVCEAIRRAGFQTDS